MNAKNVSQKCSLILLADGFDEIETIVILSTLRRAGFCAKSVGLTSGVINGAHGILLMPDLALTDLERLMDISSIELVVLPGGERNLTKLELDPRIHRLLHFVVEKHGFVAGNVQGMQMLKTSLVSKAAEEYVIPRYPFEQTTEQFAQNLTHKLERLLH